jgi:hypothetical protein
MKLLKLPLILLLLTIAFSASKPYYKRTNIKPGDIIFSSLKSMRNDGFSIKTLVEIPPNFKIHFTDSEWNGNNFGFDESDITWKNGNEPIPVNSEIYFVNLNSNPKVSKGEIYGSMKISRTNDAIFAYIGQKRMPEKIIAACANNEISFGTLLNTGLIKGNTAKILK